MLPWLLIRFRLSNMQVHLQINVFSQSSRVSTMKLTYAPAVNLYNYLFPVCKWQHYDSAFLCCADTLRWDLQIIARDMHVTWYYDSCCTRSFKNNPMAGHFSIYPSPKRSYIERMVLYFSRFLLVDSKYLCFIGAKTVTFQTFPGELNYTEIQQKKFKCLLYVFTSVSFETNCF